MTKVPEQRRRKMPSAESIHRYWLISFEDIAFTEFGQCDLGEPSCYACGWWHRDDTESEFSGLERSHLVDFARGGDEQLDNLVLLCHSCNRDMPSFAPGEREAALDWVRSQPNFMMRIQAKAEAALKFQERTGHLPSWLSKLGVSA